MKRIVILVAVAACVALLTACNKTEAVPQITFHISVANLDAGSRAVKTGWESGDVLYLWFAPISQAKPDLTLTYDGASWTAGSLRKGCELGESGTFNVVYSGKNAVPSYAGKFNDGALYYKNQPDYDADESIDQDGKTRVAAGDLLVFCEKVGYEVKGDVLTASIDGWKFLTDFQVTLTGIPNGEYALQCASDGNIVARCGFRMTDSAVQVNGEGKGYFASVTAASGTAVFCFARVNDSSLSSEIAFTLIPRKEGVFSSSRALTYSPGKKTLKPAGTLQAVTMPYSKFVATPEAVDMGLSVKWSSFNLGATIPGEYGYLYAYGETEPKEDYFWDNYRYGSEYNAMTKYCPADKKDYWQGEGEPDGKTVLDPSDDVAAVKLGGSWRMPTEEEWTELIKKCNWSWAQMYGLSGYLIKSTLTGGSIFLPAAGYEAGTLKTGSGGFYWSSTIVSESPYNAWSLYFNDNRYELYDKNARYSALSVRPVQGK